MRPRVLKFGGTSLGTPERIRGAAAIVAEAARERPIVVVASAFAGVTDRLFALAEQARCGSGEARSGLAELVERHRAALAAVAPTDRAACAALEEELDLLAATLEGVALLRLLPEAARDRVASAGERLSSAVLAAALRGEGTPAEMCDAGTLIATDERFGEAEPDLAATSRWVAERLLPLLGERVVVVPGFYGIGPDGEVRLLGRGASDLTATLLGAALVAERVEIWTDVDGVLSADPRLVPEAFTLPALSPAFAAELAGFGAKVLHPRAVQPAAAAGVPILVANSLRSDGGRTMITPGASGQGVRALATSDSVALVRVRAGARSRVEIAASWVQALRAACVQPLLAQQASMRGDLLSVFPVTDLPRVSRALVDVGLPCEALGEVASVALIGADPAAPARTILQRMGVTPLAWAEGGDGSALAIVEPHVLAAVAREMHAELVARLHAEREAA